MSAIAIMTGVIIILFVLIGGNSYIALRLYQGINHIFPQTNIKICILIGIFIVVIFILGFMRSFLPVSVTRKNILGVINSYWMGIFVYLLLYFLVADIILLLLRLTKVMPNPLTQNIYFFSGMLVVLLTSVTVIYGNYNARQIKHVSYDIQLEKNLASEYKIVLISDLHLGALGSAKQLSNIVESINSLQADIICIAGDIFDNDYYAIDNPKKAIHLLKSITAKYGVYACLGNHDAGGTLGKMLDFLKDSNITVLNDDYLVIDESLILIGRLDSSPIGGFGDMSRKNFAEVVAEIDLKLPIIVMDHNPANISEYGNEVDLVLAGHTHRGQIFPGSLFTRAMFTVDYGYYRKDSKSPHILVTSGVGTWGMPMRLASNSEIVSIKLH